MSDTPKKFYLTTPIYYVNARPHIGHAYTTIVADVIARRHRLLGHDTFFLTGTDEHGQKIERSAIAAGIPPQQFADTVSKTFRDLWTRMGILDDSLSKDDPLLHRDFIRTTDPRHKQGVQKLFKLLQDRGHIYLSTYTGQYCVSDEAYVDGPPGIRCPDCGRTTETVSESNYYFRLSAFQLPLLNLIESGQLHITPESRRNEVLSFLRGNVNISATPVSTESSGAPSMAQSYSDMGGNVESSPAADPTTTPASVISTEAQSAQGRDPRSSPEAATSPEQHLLPHTALGTPYVPGALKDLSISRTSFHWGVPVPGDEAHVIYVWLDALANYMTAIGYGSDDPAEQAQFEKYWPADLHLVGKEIIRFHCVYWPAFLLAAGLPTPKAITAHGWLLFEDSKMSKTRGNIVRTETILEAFGDHYRKELVRLRQPEPSRSDADLFASDVLRYVLLGEIPFGQDGSFSFDAMITRYNADLANGYGNLVSRTLTLITQNFHGSVPAHSPWAYITIQVLKKKLRQGHVGHPTDFGPFISTADIPSARVATAVCNFYQDAFDAHRFSLAMTFDPLTSALKAPATNSTVKVEGPEYGVLDFIALLIGKTDEFLSSTKPWKLAKQENDASRNELSDILYIAAESIRIITALLYPILPYATAQVWSQLGLGNIEQAARDGKLKDLQWGGLPPGTRLGPLAPIFPRADKGLAQIMADMEQNTPAPSRLTTETTSSTPPTPTDSTHPGAPPRTSAIEEHHPIGQVAGSASPTTQLHKPPSHTQAYASGPFNTAQSSQPIAQSPIQNPAPSPSSQGQSPIATTSTTPTEGPASAGPPEGPGFSRATTSPAEGSTALPKAVLPSPAANAQATAQITIDDFAKVELRVARILVAERIPKADKLLRLEVDLGPEPGMGRRQILSGIAEWYTPEDLIGRKIIVITNLAPRKMRGLESHGMLLAASSGEDGKPALATFADSDHIEVGARLK